MWQHNLQCAFHALVFDSTARVSENFGIPIVCEVAPKHSEMQSNRFLGNELSKYIQVITSPHLQGRTGDHSHCPGYNRCNESAIIAFG